ncbi:M20/M25/M40 family metallo-hydrolase [Sphingomonas sp. R-74633]|uniref:M28 family peptidase n=1 Tax=Sphingomonas sp. R-74633 TaxID=2751188 RepID=UPI0015D39146|nr:M28 family peptidase [Sphingomonas sp. R-74633]NYT39783.1 M20/M25/M40 family metallo-hydrolase [Sphingomonas sp. R-74633]
MREWIREKAGRVVVLAMLVALFLSPFVALRWMTSVPGTSWEGPLPALSTEEHDLAGRLRGHVVAIGSTPHNIGHAPAYAAAAGYIERTLTGRGYTVTRQAFDEGLAVNLEAVIEPASASAPTLVVGAHYDSARSAPGANDNGSGTAALLELARLLADLRGKANVRIRLAFFANEEPPFFKTERMGSLVYARALADKGQKPDAMFSLETLGFYRDTPGSQHYPFPLGALYPDTGNFVAFVGTVSARPLVRRTVGAFRAVAQFPSVGGTAPGFVQGIDWSDHWSFGQIGVPALMITDTAPFRYPHYHTAKDTPDKLDYERLARVTAGLERLLRGWR